jgi:hypothetical protein
LATKVLIPVSRIVPSRTLPVQSKSVTYWTADY